MMASTNDGYVRSVKKRFFPRADCNLECSISNVGDARIVNISASGAFLQVEGELELQNPTVKLSFELPHNTSPVEVSGTVVRRMESDDGHEGVGLRFDDVPEDISDYLHQYVLGHFLNEVTEPVPQAQAPSIPDEIELLEGEAEIASSLEGLYSTYKGEIKGSLIFSRRGALVNAVLLSANREELRLMVQDELDWKPIHGDEVDLTLNAGGDVARFRSFVDVVQGQELILKVPDRLILFQLRHGEQAGETGLYVVIPLPFPAGAQLEGAILEHSERGLSFRADMSEVYLLPGTPIRDLQICNASGEILSHKKAQVMHVDPVQDFRGTTKYLSISVTYGIEKSFERGRIPEGQSKKPRRSSFLKRVSGFLGHWLMNTSSRLLPKPKTLQQENDVEVVRYPNARGEEIVGILNTTPRQEGVRMRAPVIIIPPAYSKRKESTSGLALTLVENFKQYNRDVVVLRYDDIHSLGESYKHPENRYAGKENHSHTMSQCVEDIETTLDFVYNNELFAPTRVILLSFSLQGIMGRRAVFNDQGKRIDYWMGIMGAPCGQEVMRNAAGGVDYIAQCAEGVKNTYANILGVTVDIDYFCRDAINSGLAFMSNAKQEIAEIAIPVTWITGLYDAWLDPANLKEFMEVPAKGDRTYLEIAAGHTPLNSHEALDLFLLVSQQVWRFLYDEELEPVLPANKDFFLTRQREWARTPKFPLSNKQEYWQKYLLGESEEAVGYDVISVSDEYQDFMDLQVKLLDVKKGHSVVDMGCGTGNFAQRMLTQHSGNPRRIPEKLTLVDFVPGALQTAAGKVRDLQASGICTEVQLDAVTHTLELSPLRTLRRFLRNEFYSYDRLKGLLPALTEYSVEAWKSVASRDWMFHEILAGAQMTKEHKAYLKQALPTEERQLVLEMNRLIRFLKHEVEEQDLTSSGKLRYKNGESLTFNDLSLQLLNLDGGTGAERLPFEDESVDRILCSLVLSYLNNPLETLAEFHRILKPDSVLVVSSMQPDTDISRIYMNLIRKMETSPDLEIPAGMTREAFIESAREYVSSAAFLVRLVEEGHFSFFSEGEMIQMLQRSGFKKVKSHKSFGQPPQAFVLTAIR